MNKGLRNGLIIGGISLALISLIAYFKNQFNLLKDACYTISGGIIHTLCQSEPSALYRARRHWRHLRYPVEFP